LRAQSTAASATPADISEPQTPSRSNGGGGDIGEPSRKSPTPAVVTAPDKDDEDERAMSPVSTASSASEAPLAQKVKMNGNHITKRPVTPAPVPATPVKQLDSPTSNSVAPTPSSGPAAATTATTTTQTGSPTRTWVSSLNETSSLS
jgi:SWI/SNF-related matrix-associated actin-dependent regulator of chromatin subfamily B member 1